MAVVMFVYKIMLNFGLFEEDDIEKVKSLEEKLEEAGEQLFVFELPGEQQDSHTEICSNSAEAIH